jgi:hypothetical protein
MPRPREISDDMNPNPKRRRLNCKSSDEEQLYLQSVFPPLDEQQKFRSAIHQDQAEDTVYGNLSQLSDCDASQSDGNQERCVHDRLSECCYGMVRCDILPWVLALADRRYSCQRFNYD